MKNSNILPTVEKYDQQVKYLSESEELIEMAESSLADARYVQEESERLFWNSVYYAEFYAAKAALLHLGFQPKTHSGTDTLVGKILYKDEDLIDRETAKNYSRLRTLREEIDYNPGANITTEKDEMLGSTAEFVSKMKQIVHETGSES
jgi:uncharacterized protein (UPF0332 family)